MKKILLVGIALLSLSLMSCHKERECKCTTTYGLSGSADIHIVKTKEKCYELDSEYLDDKGGTAHKTTCEKNK